VLKPAAVALALALTVTACSSPGEVASPEISPSAEETSAPQEQDVAADLWESAIATPEGGVTVEAQLITSVAGFERVTSGIGYVDLSSGAGDIEWTDELGLTREVRSDTGHYLQVEETWFVIERENALPTTVAFEPFRGLDRASNIRVDGEEDVRGALTTRLIATLDPSDAGVEMGFSEEERFIVKEATGASLVATIWVDEQGSVVRVLREYSATSSEQDAIEATSLYLFDDFGLERPIEVAATADAIPAPA
jgi:hypothetical protein